MQKTLGNQPISADNEWASREAGHVGAETPDAALTTDAAEGIDMADSHSSKSPAFQFYPKDFLTSEHVELMSLAERGVYITLICKCWIEGSLPSDVTALARLCGTPIGAFRRLWPAVEPCFRLAVNGRLTHARLEHERKKQREFRRKQAENGRLGGRPRKPHTTQTKAMGFSGLTQTEPKKSSSSSVCNLQSSDSSHTRAHAREPNEVSERAGRFVNEVYPELYAKFRKGARYVSRPALDFQEALQLCRVWDDERLVKIATVFLTTDHEFAEKGSRTMAQFRSMASWCDSRLAEAGIA